MGIEPVLWVLALSVYGGVGVYVWVEVVDLDWSARVAAGSLLACVAVWPLMIVVGCIIQLAIPQRAKRKDRT